ncbi:MAG: dethiobiotin synthase [Thermincolia bacterium]
MKKYKGFFITGTDTGVGKTVITAGLLGAFREQGVDAVAIKPVQTGIFGDKRLISGDAVFYCKVSNLSYSPQQLNPVCLELPLAPAVAAQQEGVNLDLAAVMDHFHQLAVRHQMILVEGAGGLLVPLVGTGYTMADLAAEMGLPLLVVARPTLGTINHTGLTVAYAKAKGLRVAGVIINGYNHHNPNLAERTNPAVIEEMTGVPVLGLVPQVANIRSEGEELEPGNLVDIIKEYLDLGRILEKLSMERSG